jgi:hypothetical protein
MECVKNVFKSYYRIYPPVSSCSDHGNKHEVIHEFFNFVEPGIKPYNNKNVVPTFQKMHIFYFTETITSEFVG